MSLPVKTLVLSITVAVAGVLAYILFFRSAGLELNEIAQRTGMDCSVWEIDPGYEVFDVNISQTIEETAFICTRNQTEYQVASKPDFERLTRALVPKMPIVAGISADDLIEDCQRVIYSATIDSLIAQHLVLTTNYAFANQSGLGGLKQAMEEAEVDVKKNPSACSEFSKWHQS